MIQSRNSSVLVDFKKQSQYETVYKVEETICDILDSAIQDIKKFAKAVRYKRNRCLSGKELPPYMAPIEPAGLLKIVSTASLPPAQAPNPVFTDADVTEPPLPPVTAKAAASTPRTPSTNAQAPSGQTRLTLSLLLSVFVMVLASLLLL